MESATNRRVAYAPLDLSPPKPLREDSPAGDKLLHGYTHEQLSAAFSLVADPGDWKAPIHVTIVNVPIGDIPHLLCLIAIAVPFFTGSEADPLGVSGVAEGKTSVYVHSKGYRNGPAGDH